MTKYKGIPLVIGEETYIVPPLSLAQLEDNEAELKDTQIVGEVDGMKYVCKFLTMALQRNYPDLTYRFVAENLEFSATVDVMQIIMDSSGLLRKQFAAGEWMPAGELPTQTGESFTPTSAPQLAGDGTTSGTN